MALFANFEGELPDQEVLEQFFALEFEMLEVQGETDVVKCRAVFEHWAGVFERGVGVTMFSEAVGELFGVRGPSYARLLAGALQQDVAECRDKVDLEFPTGGGEFNKDRFIRVVGDELLRFAGRVFFAWRADARETLGLLSRQIDSLNVWEGFVEFFGGLWALMDDLSRDLSWDPFEIYDRTVVFQTTFGDGLREGLVKIFEAFKEEARGLDQRLRPIRAEVARLEIEAVSELVPLLGDPDRPRLASEWEGGGLGKIIRLNCASEAAAKLEQRLGDIRRVVSDLSSTA